MTRLTPEQLAHAPDCPRNAPNEGMCSCWPERDRLLRTEIDALRAELGEAYEAALVSLAKKDEWWEKETERLQAQLGECKGALRELVHAMHDYEMDVEESPPAKHRAMMEGATRLLAKLETP